MNTHKSIVRRVLFDATWKAALALSVFLAVVYWSLDASRYTDLEPLTAADAKPKDDACVMGILRGIHQKGEVIVMRDLESAKKTCVKASAKEAALAAQGPLLK